MARSPLRLVLALAATSVAAAGCGSSMSTAPKPANSLTISIENFGGTTQVKTTTSVNAGVVQMKFENHAQGKHSAQIVRIDPGHDPLAALNAANEWGQRHKPLPGWVHLEGGFGDAKPGQTLPGVGKFIAGNYAVVDLESHGKPVYGTFAVKGDAGSAGLPPSPSEVKAVDYSFSAHGLQAGASLRFDNAGKQPHEIAAARLRPGQTLADVRRYVKTQKGSSPIDESTGVSSGVLDGGNSQITTLGLTKPGRYVLLCFVSDRKGGPPHVLKGMIGQAAVR
jgi:plastocyanin